jgi:hypothetical protein
VRSQIQRLSVRAAAGVLCVLVPSGTPVADAAIAVVFAAVALGVVLAPVVAGVVERVPVPVAAVERCDLALFVVAAVVCAQDPVVVAAHALGALAPAVVLIAHGAPAPVAAAPVLCALAPGRGAQALAVFAAAPDVLAVAVV